MTNLVNCQNNPLLKAHEIANHGHVQNLRASSGIDGYLLQNYLFDTELDNWVKEHGHFIPSYFYFEIRILCCKRFSWAIPDEAAISKIVKFAADKGQHILEMGCGNGYWANLILQSGGSIVAVDKDIENIWLEPGFKYFDIVQADESFVVDHDANILFLCWPPLGTSFAFACLSYFKGDFVIFVGEYQGCVADGKFFDLLEEEFEIIESADIPQWFAMHDYMIFYKRK